MDRARSSDSPMSRPPMRTCVGCRERARKSDLVRVVAIEDGATSVVCPDLRGSAAGRGAHLHPDVRCLEQATKRKAFGRALRTTGSLDLSVLTAYLQAGHHNGRHDKEVEHPLMSTR